jgi:hypothetical protein
MLKILLFGALVATLLFTGCSNDDDKNTTPAPAKTNETVSNYLTGGTARTWRVESIIDDATNLLQMQPCDVSGRQTYTKAGNTCLLANTADCGGDFDGTFEVTNNGSRLTLNILGILLTYSVKSASNTKIVLGGNNGSTITLVLQ